MPKDHDKRACDIDSVLSDFLESPLQGIIDMISLVCSNFSGLIQQLHNSSA